jgi:hypothetical protein
MKATVWLFLVAAAAPLGADLQALPGMDAAWGRAVEGYSVPGPAAPGAFPRAPAGPGAPDPVGLTPILAAPGLHSVARLPGLPKEIHLAAAVEDRYDWLPIFGNNPGLDRPWLRVDSDLVFSSGGRTVFAGFGASLPLTSPAAGMSTRDPAAQALAARAWVGVHAGFRF